MLLRALHARHEPSMCQNLTNYKETWPEETEGLDFVDVRRGLMLESSRHLVDTRLRIRMTNSYRQSRKNAEPISMPLIVYGYLEKDLVMDDCCRERRRSWSQERTTRTSAIQIRSSLARKQ